MRGRKKMVCHHIYYYVSEKKKTHIKPEGRATTPGSSFFLARNAKPSGFVPAATYEMATMKKRSKERKLIMVVVSSSHKGKLLFWVGQ